MSARARKKHVSDAAQPTVAQVREETRREERERAKSVAADVERAHLRLRRLYDISKLVTRFEDIAQTVPELLALVSKEVPLDVAILMLEERRALAGSPVQTIEWHTEGVSAERLRAESAHARTAYRSIVRAPRTFEEAAGAAPLRQSSPPQASEGDPADRFVILPLVVGHGPIFGALLVSGATTLNESDLMFVNAVINQLAVALERIAIISAKQDAMKGARDAAEFLRRSARPSSPRWTTKRHSRPWSAPPFRVSPTCASSKQWPTIGASSAAP
jgi:transcriptional regulator with GAF, ATPase, and Fis domain